MSHVSRAHATDAIATRDPERLGYGYADTQHPWHHDPAFDLGRTTLHELLELVHAMAGGRGTVVQVGLEARPGRHVALRHCAARVVTVDRDPARLERLRALVPIDGHDVLVCGEPLDAMVLGSVRGVAHGCDVLLLDAAGDYETMRAHWCAYAPLVRTGGLVALVDRSQVFAADGRSFDVDRFVGDLDRDVLTPCGVRSRRLGGAAAVHTYVQTDGTRLAGEPPVWPSRWVATPLPLRLGTAHGFSLHAWQGRVFAISGDEPFVPRRLERNHYATVLVAGDRAAADRFVAAWGAVEPALAKARAHLRAGEIAAAVAAANDVVGAHPWLRAALIDSLEQAPWNRSLLLAQGTLALFTGHPREGAALLRRALGLEMVDGDLLHTVAQAWLRVLQDDVGARALLAEARQRVRARKVAQVCHTQLRGHVLWHYPQLLAKVRGVIQIGSHTGADIAAWTQLEIAEQLHVEGNPAVFPELERRCRAAAFGRVAALPHAVLARPGRARLRHGSDPAHATFLSPHPLGARDGNEAPTHGVDVPVTTLDELVARGAIDPRRYDLLFVDTEGSELEVLRGAMQLLRHVDVVCVSVFLAPVYADAPLPQDVQRFLREVDGGDGFGLRAFEPGVDPRRGTAVFRRLRRPGGRA